MAEVPIKRGQTDEAIEHYYWQLELRAQEDLDLRLRTSSLIPRAVVGDSPSIIKCCEYGRKGFAAAVAVVHPVMLVFNYILRYHHNHTPWESIPLPTGNGNHPVLDPYDVYRCLSGLCRENQELLLRQFQLTNQQRSSLLSSLMYGKSDDFVEVYGGLSNDQELSNFCWELGLYHPQEDALIESRLLEMPELYFEYCDKNQTEDWEEVEPGPTTNLFVLERVQKYYDEYCEGRKHLIENNNIINKREKELINEILMRPEGDMFRNAYDSGVVRLIEYNAETLEAVDLEDYEANCPPFDSIDWDVKTPFPVGVAVPEGKSTSKPSAQIENQAPGEEVVPDETGQDKPSKKKAGREPSTWLSDKYSMYSDTSVGLLLKAKIWDKLKEALTLLPLPNHGLKRMDGDIKSFGAVLLFYVFKQLGIASEDATYGRSFERTMVAMGTESNVLQKNKFSAGPFARNSTTPHLEAISIVLPALCQLKEGKHLDIAKIQAKGSDLVKVLVNGHTTLMDAYQYLINKLPSIFEESSDNPANNAEAGSD